MNQFTIRDIENLCGIKAHTLRIWEQRYKLFVPKRKESRHRIYDNEDLKELLRISYLYHHGYKVSRIADMNCEEIRCAVSSSCGSNDDHDLVIHQLIEASIDFDKERFDKIINSLVIRIGLEKAILYVFYPFLQRIGLLWMTNNVIPAQEHFCSHIIRKKIICAIDGLDMHSTKPANGPVVLIFSPTGEFHEIPLLAANYFLKKNNIRTIYFGVNLSLDCLCDYLQNHDADYIFTHIITHMKDCDIFHYLENISGRFPSKKIFVAGAACNCTKDLPDNIKHFCSPAQLIEYITSASRSSSRLLV